MSKTPSVNRPKKGASKADKQSDVTAPIPVSRTIRETIESIVIAFVLAFLFRTFEAEAFVIPTGSMAPTLQGMHKELECPNCAFVYKVSASNEAADSKTPGTVIGSTCPNCRYPAREITVKRGYKTYNGDRILVSKFAYELEEPERWDVFVFRYPGDAKMNYIKRLVGLPNETLMIWHGDLYRRPFDASDPTKYDNDRLFEILRKPPDKVRAMLQVVYDNDFLQSRMYEKGWPKRWQIGDFSDGENRWKEIDQGKAFQIEGQNTEQSWIRYHHIVPTRAAWEIASADQVQPARWKPKSRLIADFYAYNTNDVVPKGRQVPDGTQVGVHWVGDLGLEFDMETTGSKGSVTLELVEGGYRFTCELNLETGKAMLGINGGGDPFTPANNDEVGKQPTTIGQVISEGSKQLRFANVDDQLLLWVDDELVEFDRPTTYSGVVNDHPSADDRAPIAIGAIGATATVSHLKVLRDGYYISSHEASNPISDYDQRDVPTEDFLADPSAWSRVDQSQKTPFDRRRPQYFDIGPDQFFAMGDNSPSSQDGRLWGDTNQGIPSIVDRDLLIGKALYIYWPRSLDYFPFCPNFPRMGFVR